MAELTTNTTIKADGLKFNVRSYLIERVIDFSLIGLTATTNYEIGDLPKGFVPRNVAVIELVKAGAAGTCGVYLKSDSAKLAERTLGTAAGVTVGQVTGKNLAGAGDTICLALGAAQTTGKVKVAIAGDMMTGEWDEGIKNVAPFDPAERVPTNMMS